MKRIPLNPAWTSTVQRREPPADSVHGDGKHTISIELQDKNTGERIIARKDYTQKTSDIKTDKNDTNQNQRKPGVEQSWSEAVRWYQKAAAQGDEDAQHALDHMQ